MSDRAPCSAAHPMSGRACMKPRGHAGLHHSSGPGYSHQWQTNVEIDQRTPSGGRVRLTVADISIERTDP